VDQHGAIPFNRPYRIGTETVFMAEAVERGHISADGEFTRRCREWLEARTGSEATLLTTSCTAALEAAAILAGLGPGDEVIMPSYTFVTTATSVVLRGAEPVFVDIRPDTLNVDESLVEDAITPRTKAILPIHYAGVGCELDPILSLAREHGLLVIEDAAQGLMADYRGRPLGTWGDLGCISFHETKNVTCGEGGALLVNRPELVERAEIVCEKGTNRSQFLAGQVDKYSWVDLGSSYGLSDLNAAFLWGQLGAAEEITARRLAIWRTYHAAFEPLERSGRVRRPIVPQHCSHNAHMYYLLMRDASERRQMLERLNAVGVQAIFHYVPLHSAPAGMRHGRVHGSLSRTEQLSARVVRLPLWVGMDDATVERVIDSVYLAVDSMDRPRVGSPGA
jgi:dTDP-4-amino-4,6-dideoxygalactose transaminase